MAYADGFLIPIPTKNIEAYRKLSTLAGKIWMEYGALDYKECVGDDLTPQGMSVNFPQLLGMKKNETVIFSWILYKNRKQRDTIMKKVMSDPRLANTPEAMPFDMKRMYVGGFDVLVDFEAKAAPKKTPMKAAQKKKAAKKARA
jgi:uncharacterized protein YbaA (DUF1428 family)